MASSIAPFTEGSGHPQLIIEVDGKILTNKELPSMPENWGLAHKHDSEFPEIPSALKEKGLLDELGIPKPGVVIKRQTHE